MFTGIVEELGAVRSVSAHGLSVDCATVLEGSDIGASLAVNGVCLTVVGRDAGGLEFDLSEETLGRTSLARLTAGDGVNLERSVTLLSRLGGHLVQGHVDGVGELLSLDRNEAGATFSVRAPSALMRYVVEKGSIAVDGVSLTVAGLSEYGFAVALIPHTLAVTTLGAARPGDPVNLEADVIAKYVEGLMTPMLEGTKP